MRFFILKPGCGFKGSRGNPLIAPSAPSLIEGGLEEAGKLYQPEAGNSVGQSQLISESLFKGAFNGGKGFQDAAEFQGMVDFQNPDVHSREH